MNIVKFKRNIPLHVMLLPGIVISLVFVYAPLLGSVMAFQKFVPIKGFLGSDWIGLDNFKFIARLPGVFQVLWNTIYIALLKISLGIVVSFTTALMLNEISSRFLKRSFQTLIYIPYFLSWIILSGIFRDLLSPSDGLVNMFLVRLGIEPIFFLGDPFWFPIVMVVTEVWKSFGFGTVVYLAALTSISPTLYESAVMDGANRWKQTIHITLPGLAPMIVLMSVLGLGNILNAGFDQIYNMLNPSVYSTGDILDTFIYRLGVEQRQYAPSAAVGLFKSVVSFLFVSLSYFLADRVAKYRIF